jgi:ammonium transporter, Amt family
MIGRKTGGRLAASLAVAASALFVVASSAHAELAAAPQIGRIDGADTAWLLTSAALVLMMTIPGLALFYGGMVRRKNVLSTLMQSFILVALVSVQWIIFGYSLAFAPGSAIVGALSWIGLGGVSATQPYAAYSATVPHQAYMIYQCMFAVITPALITGAIAERMSFKGFLLFSLLWTMLIYDPLAHGCGVSTAGFIRWVRSISPVAPWCTSRRVPRRSRAQSWLASDAASCMSRCRRIT